MTKIISFFESRVSMKLEELVNLHYQDFSETDKEIYHHLIDNIDAIPKKGINDFASESLSSKSSVIRFAQKLGFTGFGELKNFIRWENEKSSDLTSDYSFADQVIENTQETVDYLKSQDFREIYEKMFSAKQIYIVATGTIQQTQAREFQRLLMLSNRNSRVVAGNTKVAEFQRMSEILNKDDLVFVLSLSGENIELEEVVDIIKRKQVELISITNYHSNMLSKICEYNLYACSSRSPLPEDWWLRTASTFFVLIESFMFGYSDYIRKKS